jgi:hypothetical protein
VARALSLDPDVDVERFDRALAKAARKARELERLVLNLHGRARADRAYSRAFREYLQELATQEDPRVHRLYVLKVTLDRLFTQRTGRKRLQSPRILAD